MQHEILIFDYLTDEATVIVPEKFLGTLRKIEVKRGDVKCSAIDTPPDVQVYIKDKDCVSTIDVFLYSGVFIIIQIFHFVKSKSSGF